MVCSRRKAGGRLGMIEGTGHLGLQLVGDRQPLLVEDTPAGQKHTGQPSRRGGSGQLVFLQVNTGFVQSNHQIYGATRFYSG